MRLLFQFLGYFVIIPLGYLGFFFYSGQNWLRPERIITLIIGYGLIGAVAAVGYITYWLRKNSIAKKEWEESLKEGGIEEKNIYRDLDAVEKVLLTNKYDKVNKIRKNYWLLVPLFLIIDIAAILTTALLVQRALTDAKAEVQIWSLAIFFIFILIWNLQIALFRKGDKEPDYYMDLRSPVFKIHGGVVKQKYKRKRAATTYKIYVRGAEFTRENYADIENFFNSVEEGDEVAVEYSPRTRHVWKIYKTQDI